MSDVRSRSDLERAARSIARHFASGSVVIVGSQSVLASWPDAPVIMRTSQEIDAYPANIREWEAAHGGSPASEEINALFGYGSHFHEAFGFYIDGVDETTAKLPPDWRIRAVEVVVEDLDGPVRIIAPSTTDMVVAKLQRLAEKDRSYIEAHHEARPLELTTVKERLSSCGPHPDVFRSACRFVDSLDAPLHAASLASADREPVARMLRELQPGTLVRRLEITARVLAAAQSLATRYPLECGLEIGRLELVRRGMDPPPLVQRPGRSRDTHGRDPGHGQGG